MRPQWYDLDNIPFTKMWPDDHLWFPYIFKEQKFYGYFTFKGMSDIVDYSLNKVDCLSSVHIPKEPQSQAG